MYPTPKKAAEVREGQRQKVQESHLTHRCAAITSAQDAPSITPVAPAVTETTWIPSLTRTSGMGPADPRDGRPVSAVGAPGVHADSTR